MNPEDKEIRKRTLLIMAIIIVVIALIGVGYVIFHQRQQMEDMTELFAIEKEHLTDEYAELSLQYEGYKFSVGNDSLVALLTTEQMKVQRLMEELRTVKATNTRRITELKRELETLRKIMRGYVVQIDSLNAENGRLRNENERVTEQYRQASSAAAQLSREKEHLTERVTLASRLEASAIAVRPITSRGKDAKKIDKIAQLVVSFHLAKNITAPTGEKTVYVRLMRPDDDILTKPSSGTFTFENRNIGYSMKRTVEYAGEDLPVVMYWNVEEYLSPGTYRADIFADGHLIGRRAFTLQN